MRKCHGGLQELPHMEILKPITKFASTVMSTERVADMVAMAARECFNGACGPSYLEIPRDVLDREVPLETVKHPIKDRYRASIKSQADPSAVKGVVEILKKSERPAILFGQQVWQSRSHIEANQFIVTVPTPIKKNNDPDLSYLIKASELVSKHIKKGTHIIYESTVYPGATEEVCLSLIHI